MESGMESAEIPDADATAAFYENMMENSQGGTLPQLRDITDVLEEVSGLPRF